MLHRVCPRMAALLFRRIYGRISACSSTPYWRCSPLSFLSPGFFLFFPLVTLFYFLLPQRARNLWLLVSSWYFYLCAGAGSFLFLLCALTLTYAGARFLEGQSGRARRRVLTLLLLLLFGTLFLFKYLGFALSMLERLLSAAGLSFTSPALELILPAGISFYLFMAAGYLIDVYRGNRPAERSFLLFALFLSFFPYLLSGPIGRADTLLPQFREPHRFSYDSFRSGLLRFLWGAFKKLVIADRLGMLVTTVYAAPDQFGRLQVIAAAAAFSIQIYCDFSAYSDMALGCAQVLGFRLMENFRTPYFSRSIGEFWRRWHISLSSWFRDYLYIPLGGSRRGRMRTYANLLIVFAVSGLWHGSALAFVAWGLLNGLYQVIGGLTADLRTRVRGRLGLTEDGRLTVLLQVGITFLLSTVAWVFFKGGSFTHALFIFQNMFTGPWLTHPVTAWGLDRPELVVAFFAILLLLAVDLASLRVDLWTGFLRLPRPLRWALALSLTLAVLICGIYGTGYDPQDFIYFKF